MTVKTKVGLIAGGTAVLVRLGIILYFTSDHHAYNVAVKRYRQKEHKATIAILDRLSPKYQRSSKGMYLRSVCQYNLAVESFARRDYDESLNYLSAIPDTYMKYDDVKELRDKITAKQKALAQERERQIQIAEAERKEKERQQAEEAQRKAEERRLYGADLDARINYADGQVHITNLNSYDWVDVEFQINPGILNKGYFIEAKRIEAGQEYSVGVMQFANKKGERFNPFSMKARIFTIVGRKPNGSVDVQSYEWK